MSFSKISFMFLQVPSTRFNCFKLEELTQGLFFTILKYLCQVAHTFQAFLKVLVPLIVLDGMYLTMEVFASSFALLIAASCTLNYFSCYLKICFDSHLGPTKMPSACYWASPARYFSIALVLVSTWNLHCVEALRVQSTVLSSNFKTYHHRGRSASRSHKVGHGKSASMPSVIQGNSSNSTPEIFSAVDMLCKEISKVYYTREVSIGSRGNDYVHLAAHGNRLFGLLLKTWELSSPTVEIFVHDMLWALDELQIATPHMLAQMQRILAIGRKLNGTKSTWGHYHSPLTEEKPLNQSGTPAIGLNGSTVPIHTSWSPPPDSSPNGDSTRETEQGQRNSDHSAKHTANTHNMLKNGISAKNNSGRGCSPSRKNRTIRYWWEMVRTLEDATEEADAWYNFLFDFDVTLGTLGSPSKEHRPGPRRKGAFSEWNSSGNITSSNLQDALVRISAEYRLDSLVHKIHLLVVSVNEPRLVYLNEIVKVSLKTPSTCNNSGTEVLFEGTNVYLSKVLACVPCTSTSVNILAYSRLYVDTDVNSTQMTCNTTFDFAIFAPEVIVQGEVRIWDISGPNAKMRRGDIEGGPGLAGYRGGNLFGAIGSIVEGKLEIISHGGNGGPGDAGLRHHVEIGCKGKIENKTYGCPGYCSMLCWIFPAVCPKDCKTCDAYCCSAEDGYHVIYRGSPGGRGGEGGSPGAIFLLPLSTTAMQQVSVQQKKGSDGLPGAEGEGLTDPSFADLKDAGFFDLRKHLDYHVFYRTVFKPCNGNFC